VAGGGLRRLPRGCGEARPGRLRGGAKAGQVSGASRMSLPEGLQNPAIHRLTEGCARVQSESEGKLSVFQPAYPEMVQLKARMEGLPTPVYETAPVHHTR